MHLVDRDRTATRIEAPPPLHPGRVAPAAAVEITDDRRRSGRLLDLKGERIGLVDQLRSVWRLDLELVEAAGLYSRQEDLPHAAFVTQPHAMPSTVPVVEVADHGDAAGVRRPHGESDACHALHGREMRAQFLVAFGVAAFGEQADIGFAQHRRKPIRIVDFECAADGRHSQPVREPFVCRNAAGEKALVANTVEIRHRLTARGVKHADRGGGRQKHAHDKRAFRAERVHTEKGEGIAVVGVEHGIDIAIWRKPVVINPRRTDASAFYERSR